MTKFTRIVTAVAVTASLSPAPGLAQSLDNVVKGELLSGWRTESGVHMSAIRLTLAPGWKTYWRAPGDAGIPPRFNWAGSSNVDAVGISWPVPDIFDQNGMRSVGYEGIVTIPMEFRPLDTEEEIAVTGEIEIGVCEEICVPMTLLVSAVLPPDTAMADPVITAALADQPMHRSEAGVSRVNCAVEPIEDGMRLTATIAMPKLGAEEAAVVELTGGGVWVSEPDVTRTGGELRAVADLVPPDSAPFALERDALRFTIIADGRAVDIHGCR